MRITVITSGQLPMPPVKGGAVQSLIEMYLKYNEKARLHEFTVYSIGSKGATKAAKNYNYTKFEYVDADGFIFKISRFLRSCLGKISTKRIANAYISAVDKRLQHDKCDVCIIENSPAFILDITKTVGTKYFLHLHNDILNKKTKSAKKIAESYDAVFAVSSFIADKVKEIRGSCKVSVLYNAIDLDRFNFSKYLKVRDETRARYGFGESDIVILYTGRLKEKKGVSKLLEAFIKVKGQKNLKLVIAGSVFYKKKATDLFTKELEKLANLAKDGVFFTGYVDYNEIPGLYVVADIGIIPSIWEEPFGLTVIEHMAMGNAIITTDSGAIPEIVNESCAIVIKRDNKIVENLTSAITKLSADSSLRKKLVEAAFEKVTMFNKDDYNNKFYRLIEVNKIDKNIE